MSQHTFETIHNGEAISILLGWDKPLQGFFMVIEKINSESDEPFWSNLFRLQNTHPKTLDSFLTVLEELKINIP